MIGRRHWGALVLAATVASVGGLAIAAPSPGPEISVYKNASCGCCKKWVEHMEKSGWTVTAHDVPDVGVYKKKYGVPDNLGSCHTAIVTSGYVVEGHVPADLIDKLVAARPSDVIGLAVPGMVQGSPGMESGRSDKYDVIAFSKGGKTKVFASR